MGAIVMTKKLFPCLKNGMSEDLPAPIFPKHALTL